MTLKRLRECLHAFSLLIASRYVRSCGQCGVPYQHLQPYVLGCLGMANLEEQVGQDVPEQDGRFGGVGGDRAEPGLFLSLNVQYKGGQYQHCQET